MSHISFSPPGMEYGCDPKITTKGPNVLSQSVKYMLLDSMTAPLKNLSQSLARIKPLSSPAATSRVALAYELHSLTPADCKNLGANKHVPIIFLHGFLGSKRENRRMSK
jgi:hypothetical protein